MVPNLDGLPPVAGVGLAALLGLFLGSFVAALVLRWPQGRSVLAGRSQCDACHAPLAAIDLIPLVSMLWLRGRCRRCGAAIDPFHLYVELGAAAIGAAALAVMPGIGGWLWALFGWLMLPLFLLDARHMWLPDTLNAILAVTGLLIAGPLLDTGLSDRWIAAVIGGVGLAAVAALYRRWRGVDGMGGGDPKLVAAVGCWIGWHALPLLLLIASVGGLVWALFAQRKGDGPLALRAVPFGSFICVAAWIAVPLSMLISGR